MPPKGRLTPFYFFSDSKAAELREAGRQRVSTNEVMDYWRALTDAERKPFEEKAAEACAAYLEECTQKAMLTAEGEGDGDGEEEADEDDEEYKADEGGEDDDSGSGGELTPMVPLSRVKRIMMLNTADAPKNWGREPTFCVAKGVEFFLERCVWDAARVTGREGRKTISFRDLVTSMRQHPCPESLQYFVEEFQPKPDPPEPKAKQTGKRKSDAKKSKGPAKQAKAASTTDDDQNNDRNLPTAKSANALSSAAAPAPVPESRRASMRNRS